MTNAYDPVNVIMKILARYGVPQSLAPGVDQAIRQQIDLVIAAVEDLADDFPVMPYQEERAKILLRILGQRDLTREEITGLADRSFPSEEQLRSERAG